MDDEEEIELPRRRSDQRSRSTRAGLTFPVGRISRILKEGKFADRIGYATPVYQAAILEYLAREVLELAGNAAIDNGRRRISPRHIQLAVRSDTELSKLMGHVIFSSAGGTAGAHLHSLRKKAAASSGTRKAAGFSGTRKAASSPGTKKAAASSGTTKAAGSPGTEKASASWCMEKLAASWSWGAKKPASSRKKEDKK